MIVWSFELGEFDIRYIPGTAIEGQALADFVTEFNFANHVSDQIDHPNQLEETGWSLFVDGSLQGGKSNSFGGIHKLPSGSIRIRNNQ